VYAYLIIPTSAKFPHNFIILIYDEKRNI
jgi:hypothetical protein